MRVDRDKCCYCGGCVGVCPENAMELKEVVLEIDTGKCSECGICRKFCPLGAIDWGDYIEDYQKPLALPRGVLVE
ncbi:MAG: hypothetical protein A7316_05665 [Candidatus Altiarchaeales archaeon WOR_SM1_86-2]|nr:MAG: hypothetical protein A7316_05665 [Candidatus Altiarchaeales archaeon WOR_SM1_86-2]ODS39541.1 MAG: hypothetical protein A7315_10865 [Candidatus Altiarchaeales archaeon WOR_SM1_79]